MNSVLIVTVCIAYLATLLQGADFNGKKWVVLAAASKGWSNYGDQADVYHGYHVVKSLGIPDENIILFYYNDIAYNTNNPTPGVVINTPHGPNVYEGIPLNRSYTGHDITPSNFLAVISGDSESVQATNSQAGVVNSGPDDHVFIYLIDHGSPDIIYFPHHKLYGEDLVDTLTGMASNNQFAKLVFYLETCYSGSIFDQVLPNNINIYATTAAAPNESSYFCGYDYTYNTSLGSLYSNLFLLNTDTFNLNEETLEQQFEYIKYKAYDTGSSKQATQTAQQYGQMDIAKLAVSEFLGYKPDPANGTAADIAYLSGKGCERVSRRDKMLYLLRQKIDRINDPVEKQKYEKELENLINHRQYVDGKLSDFVKHLSTIVDGIDHDTIMTETQNLQNRECYRKFVEAFDNNNCFNLDNSFVKDRLQIFVNICELMRNPSEVDIGVNSLIQYCQDNIDQDMADYE